ncbi:dihydrofolate reductase family protein [soil metagenome]
MARTVYYAACTLDGYIAEPAEKLSWLTGFDGAGYAGEDGAGLPMRDAYPEFFASIGSIVMGSKTYEFMLGNEWPYGDLPVWVYTSRELPPIEDGRVEFLRGDVRERHPEMLEAAGDRDLWVLGGGELASQYSDAGLLDLLTLTVTPIVLGEGIPLFAKPQPKPMRLLSVRPFDNGMLELSYELITA